MPAKHTAIQNVQFFFACLFFASLNFEVFSPFVEDFSIAKMAGLLYLLVSLMTPNKLFSVNNIKRPLTAVWMMFILMIFSSAIHLKMNQSIFNFSIFLNIVMFWLLLNHYRRDDRVFNDGLLCFSMSSLIVAICYLMGIGISIDNSMRVTVFGENANGLGIKMGVGILFLLNYCLNHSQEKPMYRPWLLIMAIPMVSLLFATASRSSFLVLALGCVLFVLLRPAKKKVGKLIWLLTGVLGLMMGYQVLLKQDTLMSRIEKTINDGSTSGRDEIWKTYLELIEKHPILGVGFTGADRFAQEKFHGPKSPHNVLIEVALYSGIFGLTCFVIFLFILFKDAWRWQKFRRNCGPLITSMASLVLVLSGQALGTKLFWTIAAYCISVRVDSITNHHL